MSNLVKGVEINIEIGTGKIDETIAEEIRKNLVNDINDLIKECYNTYNNACLIRSTLTTNALTIGDFKVGDTVKFVKVVGVDSKVSLGSVGKIVEINKGLEYPIYCDIDDEPHYGFKPEELELVD